MYRQVRNCWRPCTRTGVGEAEDVLVPWHALMASLPQAFTTSGLFVGAAEFRERLPYRVNLNTVATRHFPKLTNLEL